LLRSALTMAQEARKTLLDQDPDRETEDVRFLDHPANQAMDLVLELRNPCLKRHPEVFRWSREVINRVTGLIPTRRAMLVTLERKANTKIR
jgi:hypothetical protein